MYDSNKTMQMIGEQTVEIMASDKVKTEIVDVLKAHNVRYSADIKDIMHLAIDLYTLGYIRGNEAINDVRNDTNVKDFYSPRGDGDAQ